MAPISVFSGWCDNRLGGAPCQQTILASMALLPSCPARVTVRWSRNILNLLLSIELITGVLCAGARALATSGGSGGAQGGGLPLRRARVLRAASSSPLRFASSFRRFETTTTTSCAERWRLGSSSACLRGIRSLWMFWTIRATNWLCRCTAPKPAVASHPTAKPKPLQRKRQSQTRDEQAGASHAACRQQLQHSLSQLPLAGVAALERTKPPSASRYLCHPLHPPSAVTSCRFTGSVRRELQPRTVGGSDSTRSSARKAGEDKGAAA